MTTVATSTRIGGVRTRVFVLLALLFVAACQTEPSDEPSEAKATPTNHAAPANRVSAAEGAGTTAGTESSHYAVSGDVKSAPGTPIRYRLSLDQRRNHYMSVQADIPTDGQASIEVMLPVWTPGSYLVREYARHIESLRASVAPAGASGLAVTKVRKNRWRIETGGAESVRLHYELYCAPSSVRANWVDEERALVVGAATFLTRVDATQRAHEVAVEIPQGWQHSVTSLPAHSGGHPHRYSAANFDLLVDAPLLLGNAEIFPFEVRDIPHRLANFGGGPAWDGKTSAKAVEAIARQVVEFWGHVPYRDFTFLNFIGDRRDGLEHSNSTLIMSDRWSQTNRKSFIEWMSLVSHEFFHTWNVKRMRPAPLGPFDYESEVYTRSLWIAEGLTSYYDDLLLVRAGLITREEYLQGLGKSLERLQSSAGRNVQSLEMASFDAWIKFYRPDANSGNARTNYYLKGSIVGWLLDAQLRAATDGMHSLDTLMRRAYARFSGSNGYTPEQFEALASRLAGQDSSGFFDRAVRGTGELDYAEALAYFGLYLGKADPSKTKTEAERGGTGAAAELSGKPRDTASKKPPGGHLGARTQHTGGKLMVRSVERESAAWRAGLHPSDELIAMDGYRVEGDIDERLSHYAPEQEVTLLVSRHGKLESLRATLQATPPKEVWQLHALSHPSDAQKEALDAWLGPR